jgi:hypothetical protein
VLNINSVYICGDSFGCADPDYAVESWTEILARRLPVVNLSRVCASNLQISLQVDRAIQNHTGYVIYLATTSTRHDVEFRHTDIKTELLDRYIDLQCPDSQCDLTSYSSHSLNHTTRFSSKQIDLLKNYHAEFDNLDLNIYLNKTIIESVLARLVDSKINFSFDQAGFEHHNFGNNKTYFEKYRQYRSAINIWDYVLANKLVHRPYHHIQDAKTHQHIADYYYQKITNELA